MTSLAILAGYIVLFYIAPASLHLLTAHRQVPATQVVSTNLTRGKRKKGTHLPTPGPSTNTTTTSTATSSTRAPIMRMIRAPALLRRGMPAQHEHRFPPLLIQLLEEQQRLLFEPETALLVAVHDVEGVLPPVVGDVVAFEGLQA